MLYIELCFISIQFCICQVYKIEYINSNSIVYEKTIVFENARNSRKHKLDDKKLGRYLCYMDIVALYDSTFVCTFLCSAHVARIYYVAIYRTVSSLSSIEMGDL